MHIHRNNILATENFGGHHRAKSHCACAIDNDARTKFRLQSIQHSARAGLNTTAQGAKQSEVDFRVNFHRVARLSDGVSCERRLAKKCVYRRLTLSNTVAAIVHCATEVKVVKGVTYGRM